MNTEYDYEKAIVQDVKTYIVDNDIDSSVYSNREEFEEHLTDELWLADSVTGNASGSYTCNAYEAEEYLTHNYDLLNEALGEFGYDNINPLEKGAEWCDVTIRCYLLNQGISKALDELEQENLLVFNSKSAELEAC